MLKQLVGAQMNALLACCRYCGHKLRVGETVEPRPSCEPAIKLGLICDRCGDAVPAHTLIHSQKEGNTYDFFYK